MSKSTAKPNAAVKDGKTIGLALSAAEKKRLVEKKKRDKQARKVPRSAQQTIPYVEMCKDGMLNALEQKFGSSGEITCIQADAYTLPLESESVDYVMANMFLHHVENPGQAILEMTRILKSGGKLIIADLDRHEHGFLRTEQFDVWLGFDRFDIRGWLANANLSNIKVDDLNEQCCCDSCESCGSAAINIFIASAQKISL